MITIMNWNPISFEPPKLVKIMDAIVNKDREVKIPIPSLAEYARTSIFDFSYPLSTHVVKEDFEKMILNHFIMRRIGYETMTAFKIALNVRMNAIMPMYNKLFDSLDGWDIFDADSSVRSVADHNSNTVNANVNGTDTSDRRYSNMPQGQLSNVRDGDYISDYNYDTTTTGSISATSGTSDGTTNETITRTSADKVRIFRELLEAQNNIYDMIFKDLDSLFYQLVDDGGIYECI